MKQKALALTLMLAILVIASTVILIVDFQLKLKGRESNSGLASSPRGAVPTSSAAPSAFPQLDGLISRGEYAYLYRDPQNGMIFYWRIDESKGLIYLGLTSPLQGRVEISLEPTGPRMKGGDILVAYVKEGQVYARDDYADQLTSHSADPVLGGTDDILEKAGTSGPQGTTVELVRQLVTSDGFDKPIRPDVMPMRIQLATTEFANFVGLYGDNWTTIQINFYTGEATQVSPP